MPVWIGIKKQDPPCVMRWIKTYTTYHQKKIAAISKYGHALDQAWQKADMDRAS